MQKNTEKLYNLVKDIKNKQEFEKEIKETQKKYDFLFDEYTTALLIIDKLGRNKENISKISQIKTNQECTVYGKITKINNTKHFTRKNGSNGSVVNIEITDDSGSTTLVLWGKDTELVENEKIKIGTNVKIINGYIKKGYSGLEINLGRWGLIDIEPDDMPKIEKKVNTKQKKPEGIINKILPTRSFIKDNGNFGFLTKVQIKNNTEKFELFIWDQKVKEIQKLKLGDKIRVENVDIRKKNGYEEFHVNGKSIIKKI